MRRLSGGTVIKDSGLSFRIPRERKLQGFPTQITCRTQSDSTRS